MKGMRLWLFLFVGFILNFVSIGTSFASGVLFVELLHHFQAGEATTSWIPAIQEAIVGLAGML